MIGNDIQLSPGASQTCAGHEAGSEATIHAMRAIFEDNNAHAALLVNATNVFNLVDCQTALHNISTVFILFYHLKDIYGALIRLFITGKGELASNEGTTQGDPLAMAIIPLLLRHQLTYFITISPMCISQAWFVDDATAAQQFKTTFAVMEATFLFWPTLWLLS